MNNKEHLQTEPKEYGFFKLFDSEYKFAEVVWENEPVSSGTLVRLCENTLGWKKSTTYTVLKKLCDRGIMQNKNAVVTSVVKKAEVQHYESKQVVERTFDGSLPKFVAAFMSGKKLGREEVEELQRLIDGYDVEKEEKT
ncbi:MAG: BlaI/MecI/CopY family transcriptional regulator [Angelakisella sp.]